MVQENETHSWLSSGWNAAEKLNVLSINLRSLELKKLSLRILKILRKTISMNWLILINLYLALIGKIQGQHL